MDDDADHRFLAQRTFESLGTKFKVQLANNGEEAIAYLKGEGRFADRSKYEFPSYILTDLNMPQGDGFDLLEFLKNRPALSVVPVVMMSNSAHPDDIRQAYLLGASSFLVKPPSLAGLKTLLRKVHDYSPEVGRVWVPTPRASRRPGTRARTWQPWTRPRLARERKSKLIALATRRAALFYRAMGYGESASYFRKLL